ncbi:MAG: DNA polymerase IV [Bacteroidota bacterium]
MTRKILHIDMDAFFASVEQRDDPSLRGRPVVVGGRSRRGVVAAASYEARAYGIHSAMPMAWALRRCPDLVVVRGRFGAYREASQAVRAVFARYASLVEPLSLDEAYLDVTDPLAGPPSGTVIAQRIRDAIRAETGLAASAGVSFGKFLAKTASGLAKPDGLRVITPAEAPAVLASLAVEDFHGVGPATARRLRALGIATGADLLAWPPGELEERMGKTGAWLARVVRCQDHRPVRPHRERKSVGCERTFRHDVRGTDALREKLAPIAAELSRRLDRHECSGRTVTLKLKSAAFEIAQRSVTLGAPVATEGELMGVGRALLDRPGPPAYAVRLIGLAVSGLVPAGADRQLAFPFAVGADDEVQNSSPVGLY